MAPVVIEDRVWIGYNAEIRKGVTIGHHATIAANSVVTREIPPHCFAMGNPARVYIDFSRPPRAPRKRPAKKS